MQIQELMTGNVKIIEPSATVGDLARSQFAARVGAQALQGVTADEHEHKVQP